MWKFADNVVRQGWISLKQARRYWETPYFQNTAIGSAASGDVGINNYFPVSLLDSSVRKKLFLLFIKWSKKQQPLNKT